MTEYRLVTFAVATDTLIPDHIGNVKALTVDQSNPALGEYIDGWDVINTQVIPGETVSYIVYSLQTRLTLPTGE